MAEYVDYRAAIGFFFIAAFFIFLIKLHIPMQKIIHEMKCLLTGKSYRRIMTTKRNEIGVLAHFFNEITRNLENISSDVKSHQRISKELNNAQNIQADLLPKTIPDIPGLEVIARTRPSSEIGGDAFGYFSKENRTLFYIGDATGHGIPSALVMIMVDVLLTTFVDLHNGSIDIMKNLNKYLKPHLQTSMFMTLLLVDWNQKDKKMKWVGAGHEYLIAYNSSTEAIISIPSGGIALGMLADNSAQLKEQEIDMNENDFLILFTDGIVEAKNVMGERYDLKGLENIIKKNANRDMSAEKLFEKIALDVSRFMEGHVQEDDMTLIVIKRKEQAKAAAENKSTIW
jgi:sigma-B regulation protein RsbU (phosphoserine phosphatase)